MRHLSSFLLICAIIFSSSTAAAFCGFFVGNTTDLYSDASRVVLMRYGQDTVVSIQPEYAGPLNDFAMVIPVPQVLGKDDVKTLPRAPFDAIDRLSAPRLVEYTERDPCQADPPNGKAVFYDFDDTLIRQKPKVLVRAKFQKGIYDIVILDAKESAALETWLNENGYKQPKGARNFLAPYVQGGMYFFAAKVRGKALADAKKTRVLEPIQFRYQSDAFQLPIRLGMMNARGPQDLLIFTIGMSRFDVANRPNVFIPTNIDVSEARKNDFGTWYDRLFTDELTKNKGAVVTEYAWPVWRKCDPCPPGVSVLSNEHFQLLGGHWLIQLSPRLSVVTRLHTRYGKDQGTSDLVFRKASPVTGGREVHVDGKLEQGATPAKESGFQARYAIRTPWTKPVACESPRHGDWTARPLTIK